MNTYDYSIHYSRFHDGSASHADRMAANMWNMLREFVPVDRNARILDIGCGYGFALRALRNAGYANLLGLESSVTQAEQARKAGFAVDLVESTNRWLAANRDQYDCVLLLDVLEHIPPPEQIAALRAIHRALRPDGKLILTVPNASSLLACRWRYIDFTHCSSFTEHSLHFVLKNAGFESIWINSKMGIGKFPWRIWQKSFKKKFRKWFVRWLWLQVFLAEIPEHDLNQISFELNLFAVARKGLKFGIDE